MRVTVTLDAQTQKRLQTEMWHPSELVIFDVSLGLQIEAKGFGTKTNEVGQMEILFDPFPGGTVRGLRFGVQNIGHSPDPSASLFPTIYDSPLLADEAGGFRVAYPRGFYEIVVPAKDTQLLKETFCVLRSSDDAVSRVYQAEGKNPAFSTLIVGSPPYKLSWIKLHKNGDSVSSRVVRTTDLPRIEESRLYWRKK